MESDDTQIGLNAAEGDLIADLREAFGFQEDGQSSDVFSRYTGTSALSAGTRLDDFEILGELGRGGMGVVYRARQISLDREVALKVLPSYARHGRIAVQRFQAEAQATARLHHTNVVSIFAQGECDGHFFYAMELVNGRQPRYRDPQPTGSTQLNPGT